MIDTVIVRRVIELARFRENAYRTYMNTHFPNDPTIDLGADHHLDSKEFQQYDKYDRELIHYLLELNYENVLDLEALMFLGRGDDSSFSAARDYLAETYPSSEGKGIAVDYLSSKGPLADYLESGLELL